MTALRRLAQPRQWLVAGILVALGLALVLVRPPDSLGAYGVSVSNGQNTSSSAVWSLPTCLSQAKDDSAYFFWQLDEASGTRAADSSGNGLPATYSSSGVTYRSTAGPCGNDDQSRVITLDGSRGYIYGPRFTNAPTTLSEEVWFKTSSTTGGKLVGLGNKQTGASTQYDRHLYMTDEGRLLFGTYSGGYQTITSPSTYRDNQWHHAVATLSPTGTYKGTRLYVDGKQVAANASYTDAEPGTNLYVRVGYDAISGSWSGSPTNGFFKGSLADVALYPSALTPAQVKAHYDAGS